MITCKFVIGVALQSYQLMQTLNMMTIWLNAQSFCILQRGFQFPSYLASMEISPEDIPMQMMEVLGNMALDYGAQNGHLQKRRRDQTSKPFSPNKDGKVEDNSKMLFLMVQLLLRHERDLMAVQAQNSYVLFISTNKEGMMASLLQESVNWKKAQKENQVTMPLRQHLFQFLLKTLLHRVLKLKDCKPTDPLWESSLQSQLLLKDGSWPFQVWNAQKKSAGAGWQEEEHTDGRNADTSRANVPYGGGSRSSCPISLSSIQIQGCTGASLEIRDRCEKQQIAHSHSDVGGLHSLATPLPTHQKASPDPKQAGRRVDEDQQIQLQRQKLCVRLMDLTLHNPNVLCFLNTVFLTTVWVHLLCSDFNMMTWGKLTLPLQTLLLAEMAAPLCLRTHPLFQDMLEQWQVLRAHGQQDYGEFLCFYLGWLGTKLVSSISASLSD